MNTELERRDLNSSEADIFGQFQSRFAALQQTEMSLEEYLDLCKADPLTYASAAERMLHAIGQPEVINTRHDPRLSRIFSNRVVRRYPSFTEFYGMEEVIENIVAYFRHAAQGLEERKQVLYLLGPVGSAKSSLAERLKALMEQQPIYALKGSPINESPLGLFDPNQFGASLETSTAFPAAICLALPATVPPSALPNSVAICANSALFA